MTCSGRFTTELFRASGVIQTLGYENNADCRWKITVPGDKVRMKRLTQILTQPSNFFWWLGSIMQQNAYNKLG